MFEIVSGSDFVYSRTVDIFTCTFYCMTDEGAFPDSQWTDFAKTVLSWWTDEIIGVAKSKTATFHLLFEDGPFWIDGAKDGDIVTLYFQTDRSKTRVISTQCINFIDLAKEIAKAARRLSSSLFLAGFARDSEELQRIAAKLEKSIL